MQIKNKKQLGGGARMSEEFQYVDPNPLASASVAQVHRAKLRTGEEVVLKVRQGRLSRLPLLTWLFCVARLTGKKNALSRVSSASKSFGFRYAGDCLKVPRSSFGDTASLLWSYGLHKIYF